MLSRLLADREPFCSSRPDAWSRRLGCFLQRHGEISWEHSTDCQFDETYLPARGVGLKRDYGVHDQHADYLLHSADQVSNDIIEAVRHMPHDNPDPREVHTAPHMTVNF